MTRPLRIEYKNALDYIASLKLSGIGDLFGICHSTTSINISNLKNKLSTNIDLQNLVKEFEKKIEYITTIRRYICENCFL
jgi:hypothetical protein